VVVGVLDVGVTIQQLEVGVVHGEVSHLLQWAPVPVAGAFAVAAWPSFVCDPPDRQLPQEVQQLRSEVGEEAI